MRAIISERLRLSLHQRGKGVLRVTLHTVRCACETTSVEADAPRNPGQMEGPPLISILFTAQSACQFSLGVRGPSRFFRIVDVSRENVAQATELLPTLDYTSGRTD